MSETDYPYENVLIGNFLLSLGYYLGKKKCKKPVSVNLLQQTPLDPKFGDIFSGVNGKYAIIEFKRSSDAIEKELDKPARKKLIEKLTADRESSRELLKLSLQAHFLGYPIPNKLNEMCIEFQLPPYAILTKKFQTYPRYTINTFFENLFTSAPVGVNSCMIKKYIKLLAKCAGSTKPVGGGIITVIMKYDTKTKDLTYEFCNNLDVLCQKLSSENTAGQDQQKNQKKQSSLPKMSENKNTQCLTM